MISVATGGGSLPPPDFPSAVGGLPTASQPPPFQPTDSDFPPLSSHLNRSEKNPRSILNPTVETRPLKSFIDAFNATQSSAAAISVKSMSLHRGERAILFSKDEIVTMAKPFKLSLIGKFSFGQPSIDVIRKFFIVLGLRGADSRSNPFQEGGNDMNHGALHDTANNMDLLQVPTGPITRQKARKLREAMTGLAQNFVVDYNNQVKSTLETHVGFNGEGPKLFHLAQIRSE